jgi:pilus assembly protein CpaE
LASLVAGETLRVLLVSTSEEVREAVGEALTGRAGDHRLYWVSQPDLAPVRAQDLLPHVVLVDDDLGGINPVSLITQLATRIPGAAILALVPEDAMSLSRQAVLAGARAFVVKPIHAEELISALRQVLAPRGASLAPDVLLEAPRGRIVVFCAPKGGTGRTTLALNTAISLRQLSKEDVVLIDADYAAPAVDVALNLAADRNIADLLPKLTHLDADLVAGVLSSHASGLKVLLAPPPADLSSPISLPQVQQVLAWLKRMFAWVIVDLGLPMDETAFAFLDGADRIVMSVLPEMVGLRNTRLMLDQLYERGYPQDKAWLVLNRATLPNGVPVRDIEARLRVTIKYRVPDDQPLATATINRGVPLVMSHARSSVARAIQGLAQELVAELEAPVPAGNGSQKGSLFARFRPRVGS